MKNVVDDVEKNIVKDVVVKELMVSNEDFEKYFNKREWITKEEYCNYLKLKDKDLMQFLMQRQ